MSGTKRRPRRHQRQTWSIPAEAVALYRQMLQRPRADDEWWRLHNELCDLLQTPPDVWPLVYAPGEQYQTELQLQLEEALSAQESELEATTCRER